MKVVVGISGGVDSAVAAFLLKKHGYTVYGITMIHIEGFDIARARHVADLLDIPLFTYDIKDYFRQKVIEPFIKEYLQGKTPNPCIWCNPIIKFGIIKEYALRHGKKFATGHYVKIEKKDSTLFLKKGRDTKKDQSYFLYRLTQKDLKETLFPLGDYTKEEVKRIGHDILALPPKKESQDICFIKTSYQDFIKPYAKDIKEGEFTLTNGEKIGTHKGIPFYTIGQRRGLGISSDKRLYVIKLDSKNNKIIVGDREKLIKKAFYLSSITSPSYKKLPEDKILRVKVRYNGQEKDAKIIYTSNDKAKVILLDKGEYAITPGQSAVFYENDYLIGGGIIEEVIE